MGRCGGEGQGEYEGVEGGQGGGAVWGSAVRCGGNLRVSERLDEARRGWVTVRVKTKASVRVKVEGEGEGEGGGAAVRRCDVVRCGAVWACGAVRGGVEVRMGEGESQSVRTWVRVRVSVSV